MNKIIVITPVKDESWILTKFLSSCSVFADHILVLDQQSTDSSRNICATFPKAIVIENPSANYNESERSKILVSKARELFGDGNLLVALDADEIPTFPSLNAAWWRELKQLSPGTQVFFEKAELLANPWRCVRTQCSFAYAYVDDGSPIQGLLIHSRRLPGDDKRLTFVSSQIILMHFARVRWSEYSTRQAVYCMIENINQSKSHRVRTCYYAPRFFTRFGVAGSVPIPQDWINGYLAQGMDMLSFETSHFNAFHLRALKLMAQHGIKRFRFDPIWWVSWEAARKYFLQLGVEDLPTLSIQPPGCFARLIQKSLEIIYLSLNRISTVWRSRIRITNPKP